MRVPAAVSKFQRYVKSPEFRALRSKHVLDSLDRLVEDRRVFPVWTGMPRARGLPDPLDFLMTCEHALSAWERMPRSPNKEIKKDLQKLGADIRSLAQRLDRHAPVIRYYGIPLFVANHVASLANERRDTSERHRFVHLYDPSGTIGPVKVQSLLRELAGRLQAPLSSGIPYRPTKMRAKSAERTFLVRTLVDFFLRNGGEPELEWVALSVAAMTNGDPLDTRHMQLLVEGIQPMFSDPGEELLWYNKYVYPEPDDADAGDT